MTGIETKDLIWVGVVALGHSLQLEFAIPFQVVLWTAGVFANQVPAAILGTIYLYARRNYIKGYIEAADKRIKPFWQSIRALQGLVIVGVAGIVNTGLREYAGIDLVARLRQMAS
ncbi:MGST2-like protein [Mya arenaria]|uniref:MGST2-like protein n=1 Tax=Mya arenaria TaxID=6604 RepID=A0ABY7DS23_MYAAR|nr:MGST2-like protein [Mya arenaria]